MKALRARVTRRAFGLGAIASVAVPATAPAAPPPAAAVKQRVLTLQPALEEYLRKAMADWHVPGAALGVIAGGDLVLAKGYGVRDSETGAPVDADTVFQIGSMTKAFGAATEAVMVDQGKLRWNDRVLDHFPEFELWDPWVTREFQIVDLLAQRSGLRPYVLDRLQPLGFAPDLRIRGLRHAAPITSFRSSFAYQNILHLVAGKIVAKLAGEASWEDALTKLILRPLAMTATTMTAQGIQSHPNHATGHIYRDGSIRRLPFLADFYDVGAAGNINSSLTDMLQWFALQLGRGSLRGKRLVSEAALTDTWKPRIDTAPSAPFPDGWSAYASGWVFRMTANGSVVWHNGGTGLFKSHGGFVPELGAAIILLTNEGTGLMPDSVAFWFYDKVLGNPERDYSRLNLDQFQAASAAARAAATPPMPPAPPGPAADYEGIYDSPITGPAEVAHHSGTIRLTFDATRSVFTLEPWSGDVRVLTPTDRDLLAIAKSGDPDLMRFLRDARGRVVSLRFVDDEDLLWTRRG